MLTPWALTDQLLDVCCKLMTARKASLSTAEPLSGVYVGSCCPDKSPITRPSGFPLESAWCCGLKWMPGIDLASGKDNRIMVPSVYCLYNSPLIGCCNKMYLSRSGGIFCDCGRKLGDTGGVMPLTANSHSVLKSWGSTPGTRRPSEPKMECNRSKDKRFEANRDCLCLHIVGKSMLHCRNNAASEVKAWGGMTNVMPHAAVCRLVKYSSEAWCAAVSATMMSTASKLWGRIKPLVNARTSWNAWFTIASSRESKRKILRLLMRCFSFDLAAAARIIATVVTGVALRFSPASYWECESSCILERNCCVCESINPRRVTSLSTAAN